jgi:hypothetical protein
MYWIFDERIFRQLAQNPAIAALSAGKRSGGASVGGENWLSPVDTRRGQQDCAKSLR